MKPTKAKTGPNIPVKGKAKPAKAEAKGPNLKMAPSGMMKKGSK